MLPGVKRYVGVEVKSIPTQIHQYRIAVKLGAREHWGSVTLTMVDILGRGLNL